MRRALICLFLVLHALPVLASDRNGNIGINLAGVSDWSTQAPFIDVFKTARPWLGHLPGQWGGATHEDLKAADYLDSNGWPVALPPELSSIGTVILNDLPPEATDLAGRYVLRFEGNGIVEVSGRAQNVKYAKGEISFDFAPGPGAVDIRIQRTDRARKGNYVRNISVVKQENLDAFAQGAVFNPDLMRRLEGFSNLRFMDWMQTNNSNLARWDDAPKLGDYTWARNGVPLGVMIALTNQLDADPWFTLPHMAEDEFARSFAMVVSEKLNPDLQAHVEYSNEVWNWQFAQAAYADAQAQARWGVADNWLQFYVARSIEIAQIWDEVFGDTADKRLKHVISSQTGWLGLEAQVFEAPLWRSENPGAPAPASFFYAYAITGYVGYGLGYGDNVDMVLGWLAESEEIASEDADAAGLTGADKDAYVIKHRFDLATEYAWDELLDGLVSGNPESSVADFLGRLLPYHQQVAAQNDLELIIYEGGSHVVGVGEAVNTEALTEFFLHLNYSPEMALVYEELLAGWQAADTGVFVAFNDVMAPSKWGSWGALRHLSDDNPRWNSLEAAQ